MTHPKTIFVSDDARLRDGHLDPTDREVMRQASDGGKVFHMTSEEALAMAEAESSQRPGKANKAKAKAKPRRPSSALDRALPPAPPPSPVPWGAALPGAAPSGSGLLKLTPGGIEALASAAGLAWQHFQREAAAILTDERADYVRKLRVDRKYTWRSVARACSTAWHTDWGSNQIAGMAICEAAAQRFFEDYRQPPWN